MCSLTVECVEVCGGEISPLINGLPCNYEDLSSRAWQSVLVILVLRNRYLELTHQPTYPNEQAL